MEVKSKFASMQHEMKGFLLLSYVDDKKWAKFRKNIAETTCMS